jgi:hypothetical protein
MTIIERIEAAFAEIVNEAKANPEFAQRLEAALAGTTGVLRRHRRAPSAVDPFVLYAEGEDVLRERLAQLDVEQLKDIVAEHGMDQARLAMKWRTADRLIDLVVNTVRDRSRKGDAFRR